MGLDVYLSKGSMRGDSAENVKFPSNKYPEDYWKIGYFRSSYNQGGFNTVVGNLIGKDLYYIFERPEEKYKFKPNWYRARARAYEVKKELEDKIAEGKALFVETVSIRNMFDKDRKLPASSESAMAIMNKELDDGVERKEKKWPSLDNYSNINGRFSLEKPMEIIGVIPGTQFNQDCVYLVSKADEWIKELVKEVEIVIETCDYVLGQKDKDKYFLVWSG